MNSVSQTCTIVLVVVLQLLVTYGLSAEEVSFDRDIRPILSDNCYACHGPHKETREGGDPDTGGLRLYVREGATTDLGGYAAVVPGSPEDSELIRRILSTEESEVMPPAEHRKRLTAEQKQTLVRWVREGAKWSDQWAWSPPQRFESPAVEHTGDVRNWIDTFILDRLEQERIKPSPQADQRMLMRRLSFDLLGLPPSLGQVEVFLSDERGDAWEQLVDEMLASPHFGERMAIYWLDLVRYADTVGYHGDQSVSVSPYRDYVINAFNSNMPFHQFTREQLGGDLLPQPTQDQLIASGYNRLGMMSAEGGVQDKEYLAKYAADRVRNASSVWLGSTIGCAECHDHKFDPFTTKDFYRFAAFFADIKEKGLYAGAHSDGQWGSRIEIPDKALFELLKPVDEELAKLKGITQTHTAQLTKSQRAWEHSTLANRTDWEILGVTSTAALHGTRLTIQEDGAVLATGPVGETNSYTLTATSTLNRITGLRVEVLPHESLPEKGPGRAADGNFGLTELAVFRGEQAVPLQNAAADFEQTTLAEKNPYGKWTAASAIDGDAKGRTWGWAAGPQTGRPHNLVVETAEPVLVSDAGTQFTIRLDQNSNIVPNCDLGCFRLSVTSQNQPIQVDEMMKLPAAIQEILCTDPAQRTTGHRDQLAAHYRTLAPELQPVWQQVAQLQKRRKQLVDKHTRSSLITVAVEPREMRVLPRGNWMDDSGEVVVPGVPAFLPQIEVDGRANRLHLADWLVSKKNPVTARVFVNRLWRQFFGTGISKTLDDAGAQGEPPVHPELLDTLAVEFMESGWNVKHMVRLMVTSATYRQSSLMRSELREIDPYNRLLAHQSRFRLDAEVLRDNALSVSGLLVANVGGRSVKPYQPAGLYRHLNFPKREYKHDSGRDQYRRGLYTHWQRQYLHPAMKSFDAPAREECTAERPRSNTPLAALVLLNDPSYVEAARVFAERALREGGESDLERISWTVNHALSRNEQIRERAVLLNLLALHRKIYTEKPESAKQVVSTGLYRVPEDLNLAELAAWTAVTRTIFNMHEFIARN